MKQFFEIKKEIPEFLNKYVSSDTTDVEKKFEYPEFWMKLVSFTDLANRLNCLNLSSMKKLDGFRLEWNRQCISK